MCEKENHWRNTSVRTPSTWRTGLNAPCIMYHVSCTVHHAWCIIHHSSFIIHHSSRITDHVSCIMYHVSCIMYHVSRITYHVSCIMYHVSRITNNIYYKALVMRHPWEKGEKVESSLDGDGEAADNVLGEKLRTGGDEAVHAGQRARPRLQAHQPRERVAARLRNTAININSKSAQHCCGSVIRCLFDPWIRNPK